MKKSRSNHGREVDTPARLIDARIAALADLRGETRARVRDLIKDADPDMVEAVKWRKPSDPMRGVPMWEHAGIVCTGAAVNQAWGKKPMCSVLVTVL